MSEEVKVLEYAVFVLKDSRSKRHALARLEGLLIKKRQDGSNCVTYSQEQINEYMTAETKQKTEAETRPPNPL